MELRLPAERRVVGCVVDAHGALLGVVEDLVVPSEGEALALDVALWPRERGRLVLVRRSGAAVRTAVLRHEETLAERRVALAPNGIEEVLFPSGPWSLHWSGANGEHELLRDGAGEGE